MSNRTNKSISTAPETWVMVEDEAAKRGISISQVVNEAIGGHFRSRVERGAWETIDPTEHYDPKKFYTATEDKNGHSIQVKVSVPKNVAGQIAAVVKAGEIPEYRNYTDFYRDAIVHRAKQVAQWIDNAELALEVDLHIMVAEEKSIQQQKADVEGLISAFRANMEDAKIRRDYTWMREHLRDRSDRSYVIPERYQPQYMEAIAEYAAWLEGKEAARQLRQA